MYSCVTLTLTRDRQCVQLCDTHTDERQTVCTAVILLLTRDSVYSCDTPADERQTVYTAVTLILTRDRQGVLLCSAHTNERQKKKKKKIRDYLTFTIPTIKISDIIIAVRKENCRLTL